MCWLTLISPFRGNRQSLHIYTNTSAAERLRDEPEPERSLRSLPQLEQIAPRLPIEARRQRSHRWFGKHRESPARGERSRFEDSVHRAEPAGHQTGDRERAGNASENIWHFNRTQSRRTSTWLQPGQDLLHKLQPPVDGGGVCERPWHDPRIQSRRRRLAREEHFTDFAKIFLVELVVLQIFDPGRPINPLHLCIRRRPQFNHRDLRRWKLLQISIQQQGRDLARGVHAILGSVGNLRRTWNEIIDGFGEDR